MERFIEVGIINTHSGKKVKEKSIKREMFESTIDFSKRVMSAVKHLGKWFDGRTTFYSAPVLDRLDTATGFLSRVEALAMGKSWSDVVVESLAVDVEGERLPVVHEIYVKTEEGK